MTKLPASGRDAEPSPACLLAGVATLHGAPQPFKPTGFNIAYMLPTKSSIGVADVSLDTGLLSHGPLRKHGQLMRPPPVQSRPAPTGLSARITLRQLRETDKDRNHPSAYRVTAPGDQILAKANRKKTFQRQSTRTHR
jgi:hypothetical protein